MGEGAGHLPGTNHNMKKKQQLKFSLFTQGGFPPVLSFSLNFKLSSHTHTHTPVSFAYRTLKNNARTKDTHLHSIVFELFPVKLMNNSIQLGKNKIRTQVAGVRVGFFLTHAFVFLVRH